MTVRLPFAALRSNPSSVIFEGHRHGGDGIDVSFFVTSFAPGRGPALHVHPYAEVFIVQEGEATFTIGAETLTVGGGHVVVVEPQTPHAFRNSGAATLHAVSIHPSGVIVQTDLA